MDTKNTQALMAELEALCARGNFARAYTPEVFSAIARDASLHSSVPPSPSSSASDNKTQNPSPFNFPKLESELNSDSFVVNAMRDELRNFAHVQQQQHGGLNTSTTRMGSSLNMPTAKGQTGTITATNERIDRLGLQPVLAQLHQAGELVLHTSLVHSQFFKAPARSKARRRRNSRTSSTRSSSSASSVASVTQQVTSEETITRNPVGFADAVAQLLSVSVRHQSLVGFLVATKALMCLWFDVRKSGVEQISSCISARSAATSRSITLGKDRVHQKQMLALAHLARVGAGPFVALDALESPSLDDFLYAFQQHHANTMLRFLGVLRPVLPNALRATTGPPLVMYGARPATHGAVMTTLFGHAILDQSSLTVSFPNSERKFDRLTLNDTSPHVGVRCDGCVDDGGHLRGSRFKCVDCPDFDLCLNCYAEHKHDPKHTFYVIPVPDGARIRVPPRAHPNLSAVAFVGVNALSGSTLGIAHRQVYFEVTVKVSGGALFMGWGRSPMWAESANGGNAVSTKRTSITPSKGADEGNVIEHQEQKDTFEQYSASHVPGLDDESWVLMPQARCALHGGQRHEIDESVPELVSGDVVGCWFDPAAHTIGFSLNGLDTGVCFRNVFDGVYEDVTTDTVMFPIVGVDEDPRRSVTDAATTAGSSSDAEEEEEEESSGQRQKWQIKNSSPSHNNNRNSGRPSIPSLLAATRLCRGATTTRLNKLRDGGKKATYTLHRDGTTAELCINLGRSPFSFPAVTVANNAALDLAPDDQPINMKPETSSLTTQEQEERGEVACVLVAARETANAFCLRLLPSNSETGAAGAAVVKDTPTMLYLREQITIEAMVCWMPQTYQPTHNAYGFCQSETDLSPTNTDDKCNDACARNSFHTILGMRQATQSTSSDTAAASSNLEPSVGDARNADIGERVVDVPMFAFGICDNGKLAIGISSKQLEHHESSNSTSNRHGLTLGRRICSDERVITPGEWCHVAVTSTMRETKFYLNGSLVSCISASCMAGIANQSSSAPPLYLGGFGNSEQTAACRTATFEGCLADVRLFNRVREEMDLQDNMGRVEEVLPRAGMLARWRLDEPGGSVAHAGQGLGFLHAQLLGAAQFTRVESLPFPLTTQQPVNISCVETEKVDMNQVDAVEKLSVDCSLSGGNTAKLALSALRARGWVGIESPSQPSSPISNDEEMPSNSSRAPHAAHAILSVLGHLERVADSYASCYDQDSSLAPHLPMPDTAVSPTVLSFLLLYSVIRQLHAQMASRTQQVKSLNARSGRRTGKEKGEEDEGNNSEAALEKRVMRSALGLLSANMLALTRKNISPSSVGLGPTPDGTGESHAMKLKHLLLSIVHNSLGADKEVDSSPSSSPNAGRTATRTEGRELDRDVARVAFDILCEGIEVFYPSVSDRRELIATLVYSSPPEQSQDSTTAPMLDSANKTNDTSDMELSSEGRMEFLRALVKRVVGAGTVLQQQLLCGVKGSEVVHSRRLKWSAAFVSNELNPTSAANTNDTKSATGLALTKRHVLQYIRQIAPSAWLARHRLGRDETALVKEFTSKAVAQLYDELEAYMVKSTTKSKKKNKKKNSKKHRNLGGRRPFSSSVSVEQDTSSKHQRLGAGVEEIAKPKELTLVRLASLVLQSISVLDERKTDVSNDITPTQIQENESQVARASVQDDINVHISTFQNIFYLVLHELNLSPTVTAGARGILGDLIVQRRQQYSAYLSTSKSAKATVADTPAQVSAPCDTSTTPKSPKVDTLFWEHTVTNLEGLGPPAEAVDSTELWTQQLVFDPSQCFSNIALKDNDTSCLQKAPKSWGIVLARQSMQPNTGIHAWRIRVNKCNPRGHLFVGLASPDCALDSFLGHDDKGFGLLLAGDLYYRGAQRKNGLFPRISKPGSVIRLTLDTNESTLSVAVESPSDGGAWSIRDHGVVIDRRTVDKDIFESCNGVVHPAVCLYDPGDSVSLLGFVPRGGVSSPDSNISGRDTKHHNAAVNNVNVPSPVHLGRSGGTMFSVTSGLSRGESQDVPVWVSRLLHDPFAPDAQALARDTSTTSVASNHLGVSSPIGKPLIENNEHVLALLEDSVTFLNTTIQRGSSNLLNSIAPSFVKPLLAAVCLYKSFQLVWAERVMPILSSTLMAVDNFRRCFAEGSEHPAYCVRTPQSRKCHTCGVLLEIEVLLSFLHSRLCASLIASYPELDLAAAGIDGALDGPTPSKLENGDDGSSDDEDDVISEKEPGSDDGDVESDSSSSSSSSSGDEHSQEGESDDEDDDDNDDSSEEEEEEETTEPVNNMTKTAENSVNVVTQRHLKWCRSVLLSGGLRPGPACWFAARNVKCTMTKWMHTGGPQQETHVGTTGEGGAGSTTGLGFAELEHLVFESTAFALLDHWVLRHLQFQPASLVQVGGPQLAQATRAVVAVMLYHTGNLDLARGIGEALEEASHTVTSHRSTENTTTSVKNVTSASIKTSELGGGIGQSLPPFVLTGGEAKSTQSQSDTPRSSRRHVAAEVVDAHPDARPPPIFHELWRTAMQVKGWIMRNASISGSSSETVSQDILRHVWFLLDLTPCGVSMSLESLNEDAEIRMEQLCELRAMLRLPPTVPLVTTATKETTPSASPIRAPSSLGSTKAAELVLQRPSSPSRAYSASAIQGPVPLTKSWSLRSRNGLLQGTAGARSHQQSSRRQVAVSTISQQVMLFLDNSVSRKIKPRHLHVIMQARCECALRREKALVAMSIIFSRLPLSPLLLPVHAAALRPLAFALRGNDTCWSDSTVIEHSDMAKSIQTTRPVWHYTDGLAACGTARVLALPRAFRAVGLALVHILQGTSRMEGKLARGLRLSLLDALGTHIKPVDHDLLSASGLFVILHRQMVKSRDSRRAVIADQEKLEAEHVRLVTQLQHEQQQMQPASDKGVDVDAGVIAVSAKEYRMIDKLRGLAHKELELKLAGRATMKLVYLLCSQVAHESAFSTSVLHDNAMTFAFPSTATGVGASSRPGLSPSPLSHVTSSPSHMMPSALASPRGSSRNSLTSAHDRMVGRPSQLARMRSGPQTLSAAVFHILYEEMSQSADDVLAAIEAAQLTPSRTAYTDETSSKSNVHMLATDDNHAPGFVLFNSFDGCSTNLRDAVDHVVAEAEHRLNEIASLLLSVTSSGACVELLCSEQWLTLLVSLLGRSPVGIMSKVAHLLQRVLPSCTLTQLGFALSEPVALVTLVPPEGFSETDVLDDRTSAKSPSQALVTWLLELVAAPYAAIRAVDWTSLTEQVRKARANEAQACVAVVEREAKAGGEKDEKINAGTESPVEGDDEEKRDVDTDTILSEEEEDSGDAHVGNDEAAEARRERASAAKTQDIARLFALSDECVCILRTLISSSIWAPVVFKALDNALESVTTLSNNTPQEPDLCQSFRALKAQVRAFAALSVLGGHVSGLRAGGGVRILRADGEGCDRGIVATDSASDLSSEHRGIGVQVRHNCQFETPPTTSAPEGTSHEAQQPNRGRTKVFSNMTLSPTEVMPETAQPMPIQHVPSSTLTKAVCASMVFVTQWELVAPPSCAALQHHQVVYSPPNGTVRVRAGPGLKHKELGTKRFGSVVVVNAVREDGWMRLASTAELQTNCEEAWMLSKQSDGVPLLAPCDPCGRGFGISQKQNEQDGSAWWKQPLRQQFTDIGVSDNFMNANGPAIQMVQACAMTTLVSLTKHVHFASVFQNVVEGEAMRGQDSERVGVFMRRLVHVACQNTTSYGILDLDAYEERSHMLSQRLVRVAMDSAQTHNMCTDISVGNNGVGIVELTKEHTKIDGVAEVNVQQQQQDEDVDMDDQREDSEREQEHGGASVGGHNPHSAADGMSSELAALVMQIQEMGFPRRWAQLALSETGDVLSAINWIVSNGDALGEADLEEEEEEEEEAMASSEEEQEDDDEEDDEEEEDEEEEEEDEEDEDEQQGLDQDGEPSTTTSTPENVSQDIGIAITTSAAESTTDGNEVKEQATDKTKNEKVDIYALPYEFKGDKYPAVDTNFMEVESGADAFRPSTRSFAVRQAYAAWLDTGYAGSRDPLTFGNLVFSIERDLEKKDGSCEGGVPHACELTKERLALPIQMKESLAAREARVWQPLATSRVAYRERTNSCAPMLAVKECEDVSGAVVALRARMVVMFMFSNGFRTDARHADATMEREIRDQDTQTDDEDREEEEDAFDVGGDSDIVAHKQSNRPFLERWSELFTLGGNDSALTTSDLYAAIVQVHRVSCFKLYSFFARPVLRTLCGHIDPSQCTTATPSTNQLLSLPLRILPAFVEALRTTPEFAQVLVTSALKELRISRSVEHAAAVRNGSPVSPPLDFCADSGPNLWFLQWIPHVLLQVVCESSTSSTSDNFDQSVSNTLHRLCVSIFDGTTGLLQSPSMMVKFHGLRLLTLYLSYVRVAIDAPGIDEGRRTRLCGLLGQLIGCLDVERLTARATLRASREGDLFPRYTAYLQSLVDVLGQVQSCSRLLGLSLSEVSSTRIYMDIGVLDFGGKGAALQLLPPVCSAPLPLVEIPDAAGEAKQTREAGGEVSEVDKKEKMSVDSVRLLADTKQRAERLERTTAGFLSVPWTFCSRLCVGVLNEEDVDSTRAVSQSDKVLAAVQVKKETGTGDVAVTRHVLVEPTREGVNWSSCLSLVLSVASDSQYVPGVRLRDGQVLDFSTALKYGSWADLSFVCAPQTIGSSTSSAEAVVRLFVNGEFASKVMVPMSQARLPVAFIGSLTASLKAQVAFVACWRRAFSSRTIKLVGSSIMGNPVSCVADPGKPGKGQVETDVAAPICDAGGVLASDDLVFLFDPCRVLSFGEGSGKSVGFLRDQACRLAGAVLRGPTTCVAVNHRLVVVAPNSSTSSKSSSDSNNIEQTENDKVKEPEASLDSNERVAILAVYRKLANDAAQKNEAGPPSIPTSTQSSAQQPSQHGIDVACVSFEDSGTKNAAVYRRFRMLQDGMRCSGVITRDSERMAPRHMKWQVRGQYAPSQTSQSSTSSDNRIVTAITIYLRMQTRHQTIRTPRELSSQRVDVAGVVEWFQGRTCMYVVGTVNLKTGKMLLRMAGAVFSETDEVRLDFQIPKIAGSTYEAKQEEQQQQMGDEWTTGFRFSGTESDGEFSGTWKTSVEATVLPELPNYAMRFATAVSSSCSDENGEAQSRVVSRQVEFLSGAKTVVNVAAPYKYTVVPIDIGGHGTTPDHGETEEDEQADSDDDENDYVSDSSSDADDGNELIGEEQDGQAEGEPEGDNDVEPTTWTCEICTFMNELVYTSCTMCTTPNPNPPGRRASASKSGDDSLSWNGQGAIKPGTGVWLWEVRIGRAQLADIVDAVLVPSNSTPAQAEVKNSKTTATKSPTSTSISGICVGVCTSGVLLDKRLGSDKHGWALQTHNGHVRHGDVARAYFSGELKSNSVVGVRLDTDLRTLSFFVNGKCLGTAFTSENGLLDEPVTPCVSVYKTDDTVVILGLKSGEGTLEYLPKGASKSIGDEGKSEIEMKYQGRFERGMRSGLGSLTMADGSVSEGLFKLDMRHGIHKVTPSPSSSAVSSTPSSTRKNSKDSLVASGSNGNGNGDNIVEGVNNKNKGVTTESGNKLPKEKRKRSQSGHNKKKSSSTGPTYVLFKSGRLVKQVTEAEYKVTLADTNTDTIPAVGDVHVSSKEELALLDSFHRGTGWEEKSARITLGGHVSASQQLLFVLDPYTAGESLTVSEDCTSVELTGSGGARVMVLGNRGFSSGVHYWEVQILGMEWGSTYIGIAEGSKLAGSYGQGSGSGGAGGQASQGRSLFEQVLHGHGMMEEGTRRGGGGDGSSSESSAEGGAANGWGNGYGFVNYRATHGPRGEQLYGSFYNVGDTVGVLLDVDRGTLTFLKDGKDFNNGNRHMITNLGKAYGNLRTRHCVGAGMGPSSGAGRSARLVSERGGGERIACVGTEVGAKPLFYPCIGLSKKGDKMSLQGMRYMSCERPIHASSFSSLGNPLEAPELKQMHKIVNAAALVHRWPLHVEESVDAVALETSEQSCKRNRSIDEFVRDSFVRFETMRSARSQPFRCLGGVLLHLETGSLAYLFPTGPFKKVACGDRLTIAERGPATVLGALRGCIWYQVDNDDVPLYWTPDELWTLIKDKKIEIAAVAATEVTGENGVSGAAAVALDSSTRSPRWQHFQDARAAASTLYSASQQVAIKKGSDSEQEVIEKGSGEKAVNMNSICALEWPRFVALASGKDSKQTDTRQVAWLLQHDKALAELVNRRCDDIGCAPEQLPLTQIFVSDPSPTVTGGGARGRRLLSGFPREVLMVRFAMLLELNSNVEALLPFVDLRCVSPGRTIVKPSTTPTNTDVSINKITSHPSNFAWTITPKNIAEKLGDLRGLVLTRVKTRFWHSLLEATTTATSLPPDEYDRPTDIKEIKVNRIRASQHQLVALAPPARMHRSVFGQLLMNTSMASWDPAVLRRCYSHPQDAGQKRSFFVKFEGEGVNDHGGPYRALFQIAAEEEPAGALGILVPCPNSDDGAMLNRDKMVFSTFGPPRVAEALYADGGDSVSRSAESSGSERGYSRNLQHQHKTSPPPSDPVACAFFGKLVGTAIRHSMMVALNLPALVWKPLVGLPVGIEELYDVDTFTANSLRQIEMMTKEQWDADAEEWTSMLLEKMNSAQQAAVLASLERRLYENLHTSDTRSKMGTPVVVPYHRRTELTGLVLSQYLESSAPQLEAFAQGLGSVLPRSALSLFTPDELESVICGRPEIDVDLLKRVTEYENIDPSSVHVQYFWAALEDMTQEERSKFINFVCARSRLPSSADKFPMNFKIQPVAQDAGNTGTEEGDTEKEEGKNKADDMLPHSQTCFFSLSLPRYSSMEVCKQKLIYAADNCNTMEDFNIHEAVGFEYLE